MLSLDITSGLLTPFQTLLLCLAFGFFILNVLFQATKHYKRKCDTNTSQRITSQNNDGSESDVNENENDEDLVPSLPENVEHIPYTLQRVSFEEMLSRSQDFYSKMNRRRTVRFFSSESVPEVVIKNIIKTAGTSPSGAHTEPWTFVIVKNQTIKQNIREIIEDEEFMNYKRRMGKKWVTDLKPFKTNWNKPYLTGAPYLILVFKQLYSLDDSGRRKNHYYNEISVAIASGILIAAIHNAGLVTLTSTPLNCGARLRQLLERPSNEKLMLLFPVGFPSKDCTVPKLYRKSFEEIAVVI